MANVSPPLPRLKDLSIARAAMLGDVKSLRGD